METYFNGDNHEASGSRLKASFGAVRNNSESLLSNFSNLADSHFELLSEETAEQKAGLIKGVAALLGASIILITAVICGSLAVATLLAEAFTSISISGGLAIVSGIWLLIGAAVSYTSYQYLSELSILPSATIQSIRETIKCLKN